MDRGNQTDGRVRKANTFKLQKTHAPDHHTTKSKRPLIAKDAEEHMLGKRKGKQCHMSAMCRRMVPHNLGYVNWK